jgi:opacity protein-like surface antigen
MKFLSILLCGASILGSLGIGLSANASPVADRVASLATATLDSDRSTIALNQSQADLERQRAAERAVKDAERIRRENQNTADPQDSSYQERQRLQEQTNREVERLRQGVTDPQRLQESQAELERLRQQRYNINQADELERLRQERYNIDQAELERLRQERYNIDQAELERLRQERYNIDQAELERLRQERYDISSYYRWDSYRNGYDDSWVVPSSGFGTTEGTMPEYQDDNSSAQPVTPLRVVQSNYDYSNPSTRNSAGTFSVSAGFKDGIVNPAIGYRLPNSVIGFEIGAVFNQDRLPAGELNDYPAGSLVQQFPNGFNNLGVKTLTPNIGGDVIGYYDVSPQVSLFGGLGVYFQSSSLILQSKATTDLFKETNSTSVNVAVSGGADFRVSESLRLGAGYHSIRGVTARIGYEF